jgi:hypothetical protein
VPLSSSVMIFSNEDFDTRCPQLLQAAATHGSNSVNIVSAPCGAQTCALLWVTSRLDGKHACHDILLDRASKMTALHKSRCPRSIGLTTASGSCLGRATLTAGPPAAKWTPTATVRKQGLLAMRKQGLITSL